MNITLAQIYLPETFKDTLTMSPINYVLKLLQDASCKQGTSAVD